MILCLLSKWNHLGDKGARYLKHLGHSIPHHCWTLCHSPPELRKRFPVPTSGYCSANPHSGQQKLSAEKSRRLPLWTNFFSSSEGLPARTTS